MPATTPTIFVLVTVTANFVVKKVLVLTAKSSGQFTEIFFNSV